jgi:hypothetical protein
LLWRRWRLEDVPVPRDPEVDAAPGPGVALGGAAAIGMFPFPPLTAVVLVVDPADPWWEVGVLAAVLPPFPPDEGELTFSLAVRL